MPVIKICQNTDTKNNADIEELQTRKKCKKYVSNT